ncbi:hypothetical protein D8X55_01515 [Malacoplasma penetrans]|uniref:Phosphate transport system regulatory protein n=1 Tax=Malacoplasma penetrans (strain HF-2) TaxID=272633 RepID=Q8EUJ2_MALP2|nr:PhoU domain-containing protein [Malacoplasma penetrans]RXY97135.1 hypothetical protein D8X55_01515 [Malacoplasma penetrans]BAC44721.1 phosphate transport system regulatory protein [Malacoplasma penetrans HF-2]
MAINFYSLEKSEYELKQSFLEFVDMCYRYHVKACEILKQETISDESVSVMLSKKTKAKEKKRDIKDDCIWIISKDQPRANHLRFIVAILYSSRDLERIAEQAYNIVWYSKKIWSLANKNLSKPIKNIVIKCLENSNVFFEKMADVFKSHSDYAKYLDDVKSTIAKFRAEYKSILSEALKDLSLSIDHQVDFIFSFSIVMKYIDRTIDHLWSIYDNFLMIRNKD